MNEGFRILSVFDKRLTDIIYMLDDIKWQGFNVVQISPLQPTKEEGSDAWWMLYQPINFEIGNRKIGSKDDLKRLCSEAYKRDMIISADTVINHLASEDSEDIRPSYKDDPELLMEPGAWKEFRSVDNWDDRWQVTNRCLGGLPGLNPHNKLVQAKVITMLNEYIDCGVRGFRFDAAKSIALPEEGCDFFPCITYNLKEYLPIIYGEVLFSDAELIDKYAKYMKVLSNYSGSNPNDMVKFEENKDSYLSDDLGYSRNTPVSVINDRYYHLCREYPNTLYYARNNDWEFYEFKNSKVREANQQKVYIKR